MADVASNSDPGFTLIEALIAVGLSVVVVTGVASLFTLSLRAVRDSRDVSVETTLAVQKLEQLTSAAWGSAALAASSGDALVRDVPGYADRVDTEGRGVDQTTGPPGAFIRRWAVRVLPGGAGAELVLQVRVTTPRQDAAVAAISSSATRGAEVVLTTIRTPGTN